jgi:hypothetical protein
MIMASGRGFRRVLQDGYVSKRLGKVICDSIIMPRVLMMGWCSCCSSVPGPFEMSVIPHMHAQVVEACRHVAAHNARVAAGEMPQSTHIAPLSNIVFMASPLSCVDLGLTPCIDDILCPVLSSSTLHMGCMPAATLHSCRRSC